MLLDSGTLSAPNNCSDSITQRRYDICVCDPIYQLTSDKADTWLTQTNANFNHQDSKEKRSTDALALMRSHIKDYQSRLSPQIKSHLKQLQELPFCGGWLGYISYDWGQRSAFRQAKIQPQEIQSPIKNSKVPNLTNIEQMPALRMGFYAWAIITDHKNKTSQLINFTLEATQWDRQADLLIELIDKSKKNEAHKSSISDFCLTEKFKSRLDYSQYQQTFNQIKNHIQQGNCYQINFTRQFSTHFKGDPFAIYQYLANLNNAPFSAYLNFGEQQILSLSPERFIQSRTGRVSTHPIKGTIQRCDKHQQDQANAKALLNSEKDRAENLMIVDLMRNDLSKTAAKGSVKVTELFKLYAFKSVYHLVSTVESKLASGEDIYTLLTRCLPGGSITGAPKLKAMQLIEALELQQRGIYCGNILYMDFKGNLDSNICIRTLVATNNQLVCWAGGGIVADSQVDQEYQEALAKLAKIIPPLERTVRPKPTAKGL